MPSEQLVGQWIEFGVWALADSMKNKVYVGPIDPNTGVGPYVNVLPDGNVLRMQWRVVNETYDSGRITIALDRTAESGKLITKTLAIHIDTDRDSARVDSTYDNTLIADLDQINDQTDQYRRMAGDFNRMANRGYDEWNSGYQHFVRVDNRTEPEQ